MKTKKNLPNVTMLALLTLMLVYCFGFTPNAEAANQVYSISMTPPSPDALHNLDHVDIAFGYTTDEAGACVFMYCPIPTDRRLQVMA